MSVDFEPVRIGGRRRRIDPLLVVAAAVVVALGIAVVKPWESSGGSATPSAVAAVPTSGASTGSPPTPSTDPIRTSRPTLGPVAASAAPATDALLAPTWPDVVDVMEPQDGWGAMLVTGIDSFSVFGSPPIVYAAAWSATEPAPSP